MGLLAPLYIVGFLAIGIPILLHLIRRTPQGRQMFSSLMFLSPSPPRLTRRSRLTNLLLLLLRALALIVLAAAFARPYFYWGGNQDKQETSGRRIIFLVDVSASMRRPDLWADARKQVENALADVTPADEVGLYLFDRQIHPALTMAQWNETDPASRVALLRARLAEASPGWSATRLGEALAAAADLASENNSSAAGAQRSVRQIVLVSDMQEGGKMEALQGHEWPKEVGLRVLPVTAKRPGNASLQWVQSSPDQPSGIAQADGTLRVNVNNQADSVHEQFTLSWANDKGVLPGAGGAPVQVYVAPGHSQMVKVPLPADGSVADRLVLAGDECDFDNTLFMVPPLMETVRVLYVGDDAATDVNALRYYLRNALFDTPQRKVEIVARGAGEAVADGDLADTRLAVVTRAPSDADLAKLRKYVQDGGDLLWVGKDLVTTQRAGALLGVPLQVKEATGDFALISRVELTHPLFAPFADARFADFSKIHFWKHRQVQWTEPVGQAALHVLASFDGVGGGDPFLVEQLIGRGTVRLMTAGWQPADSQLALSSKFVPLLEEMVRRKDALAIGAQYVVDEPIALPAGDRGGEVVGPEGKVTRLASAAAFDGADRPGVYHLKVGDRDVAFAVNLAADESRTAPVPTEELAQWGVKFTSPELSRKLAEQQRILLDNALENRQKLWRWLLLGVLGLLAVETALAGRLSRGASQKGAAT